MVGAVGCIGRNTQAWGQSGWILVAWLGWRKSFWLRRWWGGEKKNQGVLRSRGGGFWGAVERPGAAQNKAEHYRTTCWGQHGVGRVTPLGTQTDLRKSVTARVAPQALPKLPLQLFGSSFAGSSHRSTKRARVLVQRLEQALPEPLVLEAEGSRTAASLPKHMVWCSPNAPSWEINLG